MHIAAALLIGCDGKTLLVRKRNTSIFMQPGGKIEPGEMALDALARELNEELGLKFDTAKATFLGIFTAPAANEPGLEINCELFKIITSANIAVAAEIEEAIWVDHDSYSQLKISPLTRNHAIPIYLEAH